VQPHRAARGVPARRRGIGLRSTGGEAALGRAAAALLLLGVAWDGRFPND